MQIHPLDKAKKALEEFKKNPQKIIVDTIEEMIGPAPKGTKRRLKMALKKVFSAEDLNKMAEKSIRELLLKMFPHLFN